MASTFPNYKGDSAFSLCPRTYKFSSIRSRLGRAIPASALNVMQAIEVQFRAYDIFISRSAVHTVQMFVLDLVFHDRYYPRFLSIDIEAKD